MSEWINVDERLPENEKLVLCVVEGRKVPFRAYHANKYQVEQIVDSDWFEYDPNDEDETAWLPEGWYECNDCDEISWMIHGNVTHWMPLPELPK